MDYCYCGSDKGRCIDCAEEFVRAIDEALIVSHIGTIETFSKAEDTIDAAMKAVHALALYEQSVGAYFETERLKEIVSIQDRIIKKIKGEDYIDEKQTVFEF